MLKPSSSLPLVVESDKRAERGSKIRPIQSIVCMYSTYIHTYTENTGPDISVPPAWSLSASHQPLDPSIHPVVIFHKVIGSQHWIEDVTSVGENLQYMDPYLE
jgi:hypothetical protein